MFKIVVCRIIRQVLSLIKMGQKKDLTSTEKNKIVQYLAEKVKLSDIGKLLGRDTRTIKKFVEKSQDGRKKRAEKKRRKLSVKELRRIKREASRHPLASSAAIFQSCSLPEVSRSTRCSVLREHAKVKKSPKLPPLNKTHKEKRMQWAQQYLKTDFSKVLWTDEMRVTLDGPDGWARGWVANGQVTPTRLHRQQGGGGVMVWAGIIKDEVVGPFQVPEGVKINSATYCDLLNSTMFKQWFNKKSAAFKRSTILMQDNAPSHASKFTTSWLADKGFKDAKLMVWPPVSPDLNPIENFWSILKQDIYHEGRQFSSKKSLWEAVLAATSKISPEQIRKLTASVDGRLLSVIQKKGGHIGK